MSGHDWQHVVLRDLGIHQGGLTTPESAASGSPPQPAAGPPTAGQSAASQGQDADRRVFPASATEAARPATPADPPAPPPPPTPPATPEPALSYNPAESGWSPPGTTAADNEERNFLTSELDPALFSSALGQTVETEAPAPHSAPPPPPPPPSPSDTGPTGQQYHGYPGMPQGPGQVTHPPAQPGHPPPPGVPPHGGPPPPTPPGTHDLVRKNVHGDPLMRRMSQGVRKAMGASGAQDIQKVSDLIDQIRRPVNSCRQIAVTSIRGGAGKTTVSALTATMIAQSRGDRVLTVDADAGLGSLPLRLGARTDRTLLDLAKVRLSSFAEASPYLGRAAETLWVLPATASGRVSTELELDSFRAAMGNVTRYFSAAVIDCGAGIGELQRGILTGVHGHIIVAQGTVDGAVSARSTLEWMVGNGYGALLSRTIIVLVTHSPHVDADLDRAQHMLSAGGMPVVHVPYDRQLATGAAIDMTRISEGARAAAIQIAAEVMSRAATV